MQQHRAGRVGRVGRDRRNANPQSRAADLEHEDGAGELCSLLHRAVGEGRAEAGADRLERDDPRVLGAGRGHEAEHDRREHEGKGFERTRPGPFALAARPHVGMWSHGAPASARQFHIDQYGEAA